MEIAEKLNNCFIEAVQNLEIEMLMQVVKQLQAENADEVIKKIVEKYKTQPRI